MNKTLKGIIGGTALLAVLGGVLAVLKLTEPQAEDSDASSETEEILLWHAHSEEISSVKVEQPEGDTYVANRRVEQTETTNLDGSPVIQDVNNYYLEGYEDLPMQTTSIRLLATRAPELAAVELVKENVTDSDLALYGLDDPIKVTFTVDDADDISFLIGDATPVDNNYYLCMNGGDTVYTVTASAMEPFLKPMIDYLGTQVTPEQADDDDTIVESVRVERSDLDYDFYFEYDQYYSETDRSGSMAQHVMTEPVYCMLSPDRSANVTHGLFGLTADAVCIPHPTAAQKKSCGFDKPFVTVTMKTDDGKTTVFKLGDTYETEDGETYYYGLIDSVDCVYGFAKDTTAYPSLTPENITSKNIVDMYVWDVSHIVCETEGVKLDFTAKGTDQTDTVLTLNGEPYDDNERYRLLYSFLLQAKAEDIILDEVEPEGDCLAKILLERNDGQRSYTLEFYDAGGMKAYISVNGEIRFKCRKSYVDTLISNLKIFYDTDQDFTMTW